MFEGVSGCTTLFVTVRDTRQRLRCSATQWCLPRSFFPDLLDLYVRAVAGWSQLRSSSLDAMWTYVFRMPFKGDDAAGVLEGGRISFFPEKLSTALYTRDWSAAVARSQYNAYIV